jgi:hypothetical protein
MAHQPLVGQVLLDIEASWSCSVTPQSVGILWTSDQSVAGPLPNTHNRQASMTPTRFERAIPGSEGRQTHALDRAAIRIDRQLRYYSSITVDIVFIIITITRGNSNYKTPWNRVHFLGYKSLSFSEISFLCHTIMFKTTYISPLSWATWS